MTVMDLEGNTLLRRRVLVMNASMARYNATFWTSNETDVHNSTGNTTSPSASNDPYSFIAVEALGVMALVIVVTLGVYLFLVRFKCIRIAELPTMVPPGRIDGAPIPTKPASKDPKKRRQQLQDGFERCQCFKVLGKSDFALNASTRSLSICESPSDSPNTNPMLRSSRSLAGLGDMEASLSPIESSLHWEGSVLVPIHTGESPNLCSSQADNNSVMSPPSRQVPNYCVICLCEYQINETIVWSHNYPSCIHAFHQECLLNWLSKFNGPTTSCPICKVDFLPMLEFTDEDEKQMPVTS